MRYPRRHFHVFIYNTDNHNIRSKTRTEWHNLLRQFRPFIRKLQKPVAADGIQGHFFLSDRYACFQYADTEDRFLANRKTNSPRAAVSPRPFRMKSQVDDKHQDVSGMAEQVQREALLGES